MPTIVKAYLGTTPLFTGDSGTSSASWVRPSDWLALPVAQANSVKILHAVFDQTENYVVIKMQTSNGSAYTIDWGDGTSTTNLSNTNITYNYSYSSSGLDGTLSTRGYKQAIITITPVGSATFTLCDLSQKITSPAGMQMYATGLLDVNLNLPNLITGQRLLIGSAAVRHSHLERVYIGSWGLVSNLSLLFQYCTALQSLNETEWNMSNITTVGSMFFDCSGIKVIDGSNWNMSKVTIFASMFQSCATLQKVICTNWVTSATISLGNMFYLCGGLTNIDVSSWNTANCTTFTYLFSGCRSLTSINVRNWNAAKVTTINNMFENCVALQEVDMSLWSLPLCTNVQAAFINCHTLRKLGPCNFNAVTNLTATFNTCRSLTSCTISWLRATVDFTSCRLPKAALDTIFSNLTGGAASRTITITGNYGADTAISKTTCGTTANSRTVTQLNTSSLQVGMQVLGTGVTTAVAVTFQDAGDTVTRTAHGLDNGTIVSFSTITSTTGIAIYLQYYVINATANTFQLSATSGGAAVALSTNGSGNMLYPAYITAITTNSSFQMSAPASATGSVTLTARILNTFPATSKGWTVTG
jgi:surface protein